MTNSALAFPAAPARETAALEVSVIENVDDLIAVRSEWNALLASSRADCIFLTWEWLYTWFKHLGSGRQLFIVAVRREGELIGLAPLTMKKGIPFTRMEFAGVGTV